MTSKMQGVLRPSVYRFKLGAFELTTILDGVVQRDGPRPPFGANVPAEDVHALAAAHRLPTANINSASAILASYSAVVTAASASASCASDWFNSTIVPSCSR